MVYTIKCLACFQIDSDLEYSLHNKHFLLHPVYLPMSILPYDTSVSNIHVNYKVNLVQMTFRQKAKYWKMFYLEL